MTKNEALEKKAENARELGLMPYDGGDYEPEQEPVATDWERIARVQDAKLRAMCNEVGGFEKLCEVMDKYEHTTPPQQEKNEFKPDWDEKLALTEEVIRLSKRIEELEAQPEQEPVGWAEHGVINWLADKQFNHTSFLYDTPAQRTWVGLTDREIDELWMSHHDDFGNPLSATGYERAIEAKLKEKNK